MSSRLSLVVAVASVAAAVAIISWRGSKHEDVKLGAAEPRFAATPVNASRIGVDPQPIAQDARHAAFHEAGDAQIPGQPEASMDAAAAVATILDLRAQFGSVLENSELDAPLPTNGAGDSASEPPSFDDFLRATAGVLPTSTDTATSGSKNEASDDRPDDRALARSLREAAEMLSQRAVAAEVAGDSVREQRFSGLALLLAAEADRLNSAD